MLSYNFSNKEVPNAFVCYIFMCVCTCFYVSVCRLTYLSQSIFGKLKSCPITSTSLIFSSVVQHNNPSGESAPQESISGVESVVAGVSGLLRFLLQYVH